MDFNSFIAFDEDVFEKALENLKKEGVETDIHQLKRVYKISAKYTQEKLRNEPYCSIYLNGLGYAYYHLYDANIIKTNQKNRYKFFKEEKKDKVKHYCEVAEERVKKIKMNFEKYRPTLNVNKDYMYYPIIQNLRRKIKRRKITPEQTEKIENAIK